MLPSCRRSGVAIVVICVAVVVGSFTALDCWLTQTELNASGDARLAQSARIIDELAAAGSFDANFSRGVVMPRATVSRASPRTGDADIGFEIWTTSHALSAASTELGRLALDAAPPGIADVVIDGVQWRVFTLSSANGRWVRVGERCDYRSAVHGTLVASSIACVLVIALLVRLVLPDAADSTLPPIRELADQLATWRPHQIEPVGEDVTGELVPIVTSINGLPRRVNQNDMNPRPLNSSRPSPATM